MNYSYLILVIAGLAMAVTGFVKNGKSLNGSTPAAVLFLAGIILLAFGILLTSVPGFFSG